MLMNHLDKILNSSVYVYANVLTLYVKVCYIVLIIWQSLVNDDVK